MWRSVLLHEFPNGDVRNFSAIEGSATVIPQDVDAIGPDDVFEYTLNSPLHDVIGLSCRVRVRVPLTAGLSYQIVRVGDDVSFGIELDTTGIQGGLYPDLDLNAAAPDRLFLRVGSSSSHRGVVILHFNTLVDLRFDWHTNGQARVLVDGQLVAYAKLSYRNVTERSFARDRPRPGKSESAQQPTGLRNRPLPCSCPATPRRPDRVVPTSPRHPHH